MKNETKLTALERFKGKLLHEILPNKIGSEQLQKWKGMVHCVLRFTYKCLSSSVFENETKPQVVSDLCKKTPIGGHSE